MMNVEEFVLRLHTSTVEWVEAVQRISDSDFNRGEEARWSPGQIFMHLVLTEKGIASILSGPSQPASDKRASMLERVERGLTDYDVKIAAPPTLEPRADVYDKQRLLQRFVNGRNALVEIAENSSELNNLFTSYAHPYFGVLTGTEWLHNIVLHADRHLRQLQRATTA